MEDGGVTLPITSTVTFLTFQVLRSKNGFANQALDRGHDLMEDQDTMP